MTYPCWLLSEDGLDPLMMSYNKSLPYNCVFYAQDIAGSIAWARANKDRGILSEHEFPEIQRGFDQVSQE